jgi:glycosyltransferase involved in cell wall biosynthesis
MSQQNISPPQQPFLSVVMPAYNVEKYIEKACLSLINQSFDNFEVIVIEDGSTDQTLTKIIQCIGPDPRFKIIQQINAGASISRNRAMARATGQYIYFFDSDDEITLDAFEKLHQITFLNNNPDVILFNGVVIDETGQSKADNRYIRANPTSDSIQASINVLADTDNIIVSPCLFITRADIAQALRFTPDIYYEDNIFFCDLLAGCDNILSTPDQLFRRRIRENSITSSKVTQHHIASMQYVALSLSIRARLQRSHELRHAIAKLARRMFAEAVTIFFRAARNERGDRTRQSLIAAYFVCVAMNPRQSPKFKQLIKLLIKR